MTEPQSHPLDHSAAVPSESVSPAPGPARPAAPLWQPITPHVPAALPKVPTEYHQFWRTERYTWWRPLLALVLSVALWGLAIIVGSIVWVLLETAVTGRPPRPDVTTPLLFAVNNVMVGLLVPICLFASWLFTGQRPGWLISIGGGFRWHWVRRCLAIIVPIWLVYMGVQTWLSGVLPTLAPNDWTIFLIVVILLTTPFQAAGEELLLRGVFTRTFGAWIPNPRIGMIVATAASALVFMALHGAGDPWLNAFYCVFAVCASVLVWRTGGLEAAIVIHVVNNMLAEALMPVSDIAEVFNRGAGAGSPWLLIDMSVVVFGSALLYWQAGRMGLARKAAPAAAAEPDDRAEFTDSDPTGGAGPHPRSSERGSVPGSGPQGGRPTEEWVSPSGERAPVRPADAG